MAGHGGRRERRATIVVVEEKIKKRPLGPGRSGPLRHLNPKLIASPQSRRLNLRRLFLLLLSLLLCSSKSINTATRHAQTMRTLHAQSQCERRLTLFRLQLDVYVEHFAHRPLPPPDKPHHQPSIIYARPNACTHNDTKPLIGPFGHSTPHSVLLDPFHPPLSLNPAFCAPHVETLVQNAGDVEL